jgi:hypothetical protein
MLDEEMDNIIRDASNQHYPTYDDQAWSKMERQLDKHLPQKKNKRKYLLFLLLFLLVDSGIFFAFFYPKKHTNLSQPETIASTSKHDIANKPLTALNNRTENLTTDFKTQDIQQQISTTAKVNKQLTSQLITSTKNSNNNTQKPGKVSLSTKARFKSQVSYDVASDTTETVIQKQDVPLSGDTKNKNLNNSTAIVETNTSKENKIINQSSKPVIAKNNDTSSNKQATANRVSKQEKKKINKFDDNFAFTISAGPGLSYVDLEYLGKTTFSYGAGIRYNFAKRFAIRTGFYVTKKIYSANPSDYNPPESFWTYYPTLQKIEANCKVYEIPLNISYDLAQSKKYNLFVSFGLASYIMKQEVYNYYSKDPAGQTTFTNSATINDQNKNVLSILTLSGGYQYNINSRFSLVAEPYIEVPLSGIGFGKINLNSGGLLFTAIIKPFAHNK